RKKIARRQGVTCDQCRTKHLRCDLDDRRAAAASSTSESTAELAALEMAKSTSTGTSVHQIRCTRCEDKGFVCTKTHAPPSRRYPRPSRTGKRIEQARQMHGTSAADAAVAKAATASRINSATILIRALTELRGAEVRITDRVMAGSLSLQLLNCFFATCHMQAPVVDFGLFSKTFNTANGDPRKMSIMSNGGSVEEGLPSCIPYVQGLDSTTWPDSHESKIGTPGSTEALIAVLHAWAAHYTDAPIAFGPDVKDLESSDARLQEVDDDGGVLFATESSADVRDPDTAKVGQRRPKRKQGVACDTCRLRRVRCDVTERPEGMGCSRCEDKRIKCTDEYIQTKKAKLLAKGIKAGKGAEAASLEESLAANEHTDADPNKLSPRAWISSKREGIMRTYRPGDLEHNLRRGKARKPFCHALLNHALSLVHKYDLLQKPSLESVQVLCLLAPLLDSVDGVQAHMLADLSAAHCEKLGISTKLVVDETDRHAVENMLNTMQDNRAYLTAWCRDAVVSGLNRRVPFFKTDRAIEVVGQASFRKDPSPNSSGKDSSSTKQGEVVLSGEMGLTFVIMTMVQIGALSRFVANHVDGIEGREPSIPPWQRPAGAPVAPPPVAQRFSPRPQLNEVRKLERACGAVWNSLDSLMLFFDRCASKAKTTMDTLQPFRPLGWIATTKICGALLYLTIFRALGERHRANATYMATVTHSRGASAVSDEDRLVASTLKSLFDKSMERAILSSRKTARLIEVLLPLGILQTGGPITKQIFPIAQFLAKIPSVSDEHAQTSQTQAGKSDALSATLAPSSSAAAAPSNFVDPQALHRTQPGNDGHQQRVATSSSSASFDPDLTNEQSASAQVHVLRELEDMHRVKLGPYTHSAKRKEVDALVEGLSQLGYAWDTMDREIRAIQDILKA
ncbi:hypothetical protein BCV70DRAFT_144317, partial [Testicularia cyperi]